MVLKIQSPRNFQKMVEIKNIEIKLLSKKNYLRGYITLEEVQILEKLGQVKGTQ